MVNFVATTHPLGQKRCRRVLRLPECQFYRKGVGALLTPFCRLLKSEMAPDTNASWRDDGYAAHPIVLIIGSLSSESGFFDAQTGGSCRKYSCSTPDQRQNTGIFAGERKEECMKGVSWNATPPYTEDGNAQKGWTKRTPSLERNATQGRKPVPWFRAELPARREQRTNKEESDWITKHYPVDGRQKSPSSLSALDIGFTEVSDQWRARLHRLSAGGKWKKPADRCSRRKTNSTAKQRWILNARFVPYLSLKDTKR